MYEYLHVKDEFRRRGIGTALLAAVWRELREAGKKNAFLDCADDNPATQQFYVEIGWELDK
jgi:ribosomal protein S18 acetylase RimI-like enzyme